MLYATGSIQTESGTSTYKDDPIQGTELIEKLGLSKSDVIEFHVHPSRINVDVAGNRNFPTLTLLQTECSINISKPNIQCSLTLRYATNRTTLPNGTYNYTPTRIEKFKGEVLLLNKQEESDLYVYFLLHPLNADSPAYKNDKQPLYHIYDRQLESERRIAYVKMQSEVMNEIMRMDPQQLEIKCRGMVYRGADGQIAMIPTGALPDELRLHLNNLLARDGGRFIESWRDASSNLRGQIMVALDRQIIVAKTLPNGGVAYYWNEANGGGELISASQQDGDAQLFLHFQQNYANLASKLAGAISFEKMADIEMPAVPEVESVRDLGEKALMKLSNEKLVTMALHFDVIVFNRDTLEVKMLDKSGKETDRVLYQASDTASWKDDFIKAMKAPAFVPIKKHMIEAIQIKAEYVQKGGDLIKN